MKGEIKVYVLSSISISSGRENRRSETAMKAQSRTMAWSVMVMRVEWLEPVVVEELSRRGGLWFDLGLTMKRLR